MKICKDTTLWMCIMLILLLSAGCLGSKKIYSGKTGMPEIDLSHWKVTIPAPREDGRPIEIVPPEILNYDTIKALEKFMYPDRSDGSIVFYAYPASSTPNSKYSRSELREQIAPGRNDVNWRFQDGAYMKVTMSVPEVSQDEKGKSHRVIVAQIHGKLTKDQQKLIGQKDTNAPPILKVYYSDGMIEAKVKKYFNKGESVEEMLEIASREPTLEETLVTKNWVDDEGHFFKRNVGSEKFTLEVSVSDGQIALILDGKENVVFDSRSIQQWSVFENYFKTGNYLTTRDRWAYSKVKIYELEVSHSDLSMR